MRVTFQFVSLLLITLLLLRYSSNHSGELLFKQALALFDERPYERSYEKPDEKPHSQANKQSNKQVNKHTSKTASEIVSKSASEIPNDTQSQHAHYLLYVSASQGHIGAATMLLEEAQAQYAASQSLYWHKELATLAEKTLMTNAEGPLARQQNPTSATLESSAVSTVNSVLADAAFNYALNLPGKGLKRYWLGVASKLSHAPASFELALLLSDSGVSNDKTRLSLLKKAGEQGHVQALRTLASYYFNRLDASTVAAFLQRDRLASNTRAYSELENALYWLEKAASFDGASAFTLAGMYWEAEKPEHAMKYYRIAEAANHALAAEYVKVISEYNIVPLEHLFGANRNSANTCLQTLQFVANDLHSVAQARRFKQLFEQDARFSNLPICVNDIAWLSSTELQCKTAQQSHRIDCDLRPLANMLEAPQFTHLIVFAEQGRAYVQRGVMYLDRQDEYSVFVHELAHFAHFVDEYALSPAFAQQQCRLADAPNLLIAQANQSLDKQKLAYWNELSGELSAANTLEISKSRTCENAAVTSYKPSADITFLEHHDTHYIPAIYLDLWHQELRKDGAKTAVAQEFMHLAIQNQSSSAIQHWQTQLKRSSQLMPALESAQSTSP
ncbi:hypothetical protein ACFO4O_02865 [Glaciecola siphonariae]|uniref:Sel1 repeat family protein n=1 Tax=Glaciecola siphonariae TaxID=521012 RepID=A0ABV9LSJ1_9ALTE